MHTLGSRTVVYTSTRADGNMDARFDPAAVVAARRAAWWGLHAIEEPRVACMRVEHGAQVVDVSDIHTGVYTEYACDALVTHVHGLSLMLLTADCYPVSFFDPMHGVIALAHCGWKSLDAGLVHRVVAHMCSVYGSRPHDILVDVGPGIAMQSYIVEQPSQKDTALWKPYVHRVDAQAQTYMVDVCGVLLAQVAACGVISSHVIVRGIDTATHDAYFSHYRATRTGEHEGRFATVVTLQ